MVVLIPAYEPDERLIKLVKEIRQMSNYKILVVDDGSGEKYKKIFNSIEEEGAVVLSCNINKGKGEALKSGFKYISSLNENDGIVTADCDGQHLVKDIINVAKSIKEHKDKIILGTRRFIGEVPLRSRVGNDITRAIFSLASGVKVYDTQTGLRGFSMSMLQWISNIPGSRYEYEMNQLLNAKNAGYDFYELQISTVYLEENKSSHFNVLRDSLSIYLPIIKFSMSSIFAGLLDFILLMLVAMITSNLFISVLISRMFSATFNYIVNRNYVFEKTKSKLLSKSAVKYILLASIIVLLNYATMKIYIFIGLPLMISKIFTEITIFFFSYIMQKKYVFI